MKVTLKEHICIIEREDGDQKYYGTVGAKGESLLLEHIKRELIKQGHDVIKKRMWKDGHLMGDEYQQYIRSRSKKAGIMIYSTFYAVEGINDVFNRDGKVTLAVSHY